MKAAEVNPALSGGDFFFLQSFFFLFFLFKLPYYLPLFFYGFLALCLHLMVGSGMGKVMVKGRKKGTKGREEKRGVETRGKAR